MDKLMLGTKAYRKAFEEANGDWVAYHNAIAALGKGHLATAGVMWSQFTRELMVRDKLCANMGELLDFLKRLPIEHQAFTIVTTTSPDPTPSIMVESNPITKTITIIK